jgi:putative DNA primase/helicase
MNANYRYSRGYIERLDMGLVSTPPGCKGPRSAGWQQIKNMIRDPDHWRRHPNDGIAVVLQHNGLVSLDIDDEPNSIRVFDSLGVDLSELRREFPCIRSRPGRCRIMFRAPAESLTAHALRWPRQNDSTRFAVIFEMRAGLLADTLPPTQHIATGLPYTWETSPRNGFRELPASLLTLWRQWPQTERAGLSVCPWYKAPPPQDVRIPKPRDPNSPSVIAAFNEAHDVEAILETAGYVKKGKRFSKPGSQHAPGLKLLDNGKVYSHHAGDILGDGKAHDAFDLYALFDHGGNFGAAVKAAAQALGLTQERAHGP